VLNREGPNTFVREIEFRGDRMKERVTLDPQKSVTFERIEGPVMGTIRNFIDEENGQLSLRFAFQLSVKGLEAGTPAEREYAAKMETSYLGAVDSTLNAIRKLHDEGTGQVRAPAWLKAYYADVDAQNMKAFLAHHTDDARVLFGNNPAAIGHEQIGGAIGGLWSAIDGLSHRMVNVWEVPGNTVMEAAVTYHRKDGKTVTVPCVSILQRRDDKVSELRVHIDLAPVFA
jgi:ketosteroid isomerase-like protein